MTKIEYNVERTETIELPNCFCGEEPELAENCNTVGDYKYKSVYIKCPYCNAQAGRYRSYATFKPKWKAIEEAAEDWIKLIRREDE